ncbi:MAG: FlgD Ig-like domain [Verrucomicrobiota bacterium]
MTIRPVFLAALLVASSGVFAQDKPAAAAPALTGASANGVSISFVPPPMDGTLSVGVYDAAQKLVRTLHSEATKKDFTIGVNGFITKWDGKDNAGAELPPGKYSVRGWMVGDIGVEGIAYHGNDWMRADDSPRVVRAVGVKNVGTDEIHVWLEHVRGEQLEFSWSMKKAGAPTPKIDITPVVENGAIHIRKEGADAVEIALAEGERAIAATPGFENTTWAIVETAAGREVRAYTASGEFARRLAYGQGEPAPQQIAASYWSETIFLIEEGGGEQRVRALALGADKKDAKAAWKVVYLKRILASAKFEDIAGKLGRPKPFEAQPEVKITTRPNPLEQNNAKGELALKITTTASGAMLQSADGLPLIHLSDTPGLKWAVLGREGEAITVFQGDGALVEEFKIGRASNMMSFNAGEYELKAK